MNSNQRKKIIAVIFCFVQLFQSYAQTFSSNCNRDSLQAIQDELKLEELSCGDDENFKEFAWMYIFLLKKTYNRLDKPYYYCEIPMFSKLFDFLLLHGLDLDYDPAKDVPVFLSLHAIEPKIIAIFDSIRVDQNEKNILLIKQHDLFGAFVILNEYYSEKIIPSFEEEPNINIENIISNIKLYGSLSYPEQVSSILRGDYRTLTRKTAYGRRSSKE